MSYKVIYELQTGKYAGWVAEHLCSDMLGSCQECGREINESHYDNHPFWVGYDCGGIYKETVDAWGYKCWMGECGKPKQQQELVLTVEDEDA